MDDTTEVMLKERSGSRSRSRSNEKKALKSSCTKNESKTKSLKKQSDSKFNNSKSPQNVLDMFIEEAPPQINIQSDKIVLDRGITAYECKWSHAFETDENQEKTFPLNRIEYQKKEVEVKGQVMIFKTIKIGYLKQTAYTKKDTNEQSVFNEWLWLVDFDLHHGQTAKIKSPWKTWDTRSKLMSFYEKAVNSLDLKSLFGQ